MSEAESDPQAARSASGKHSLMMADWPKIENDTVFEVRPIYRVIQAKLMEWANKKPEIYARSRKFHRWR